ncbi:serine/threonine-protein kinase [Lipingzhangella sp. LS1_29]|uniref:Serine/threonine-protein kinase n=1 Tax=Lipingzhangella rawalii TaxID=2055835 RepID=A0ABU2H583_9ACTN|nr:serine/threonine-protein kinase [Lipingzhangella rawalii]MDS1270152.1 serine/threonine-protein kinase [Lipingzhangella rawalii]
MSAPHIPPVPGYEDPILVYRGRGCMVYRAVAPRLQTPVALKVLHSSGASAEVERMRTLGDVGGTVPLLALEQTPDGHPVLVMPFYPGGSYAGPLSRGEQLSAGELLRLARAVASALHVLHSRGLLHNDVVPGNILRAETSAVLTDVGALAEPGSPRPVRTSSELAFHAPPEVLRKEPTEPGSDTYAFASTLWSLTAGRLPFAGHLTDPSDAYAYARTAMRQPVPDLPRTDVPPDVGELLRQAMARRPADRPAPADLVAALQDVWLREPPSEPAPPASRAQQPPVPAAPHHPAPPAQQDPQHASPHVPQPPPTAPPATAPNADGPPEQVHPAAPVRPEPATDGPASPPDGPPAGPAPTPTAAPEPAAEPAPAQTPPETDRLPENATTYTGHAPPTDAPPAQPAVAADAATTAAAERTDPPDASQLILELAQQHLQGWTGAAEASRLPGQQRAFDTDPEDPQWDEDPEWVEDTPSAVARLRTRLHVAAVVGGVAVAALIGGLLPLLQPEPWLGNSTAEAETVAAQDDTADEQGHGSDPVDDTDTGEDAAEPTEQHGAPAAPTEVTLDDHLDRVELRWNDNTGGQADYFVVGGPADGAQQTMTRTGAGVTSTQVATADTYVEYCFTVVAVDATASSGDQVCTTRAASRAEQEAEQAEEEEADEDDGDDGDDGDDDEEEDDEDTDDDDDMAVGIGIPQRSGSADADD